MIMDEWSNPEYVQTSLRKLNIKNKCDYRVVLKAIKILNDPALLEHDKYDCLFSVFFEEYPQTEEMQEALEGIYQIINTTYGQNEPIKSCEAEEKLMDWHKDFKYIAPPVSRVLGYDVRDPNKTTHWNSFVGAYQEIGECFFSQIVSMRQKMRSGKKLENWEREFVTKNYELIVLDADSDEDNEYLKGG